MQCCHTSNNNRIKCKCHYLLLSLFSFLFLVVWTALFASILRDNGHILGIGTGLLRRRRGNAVYNIPSYMMSAFEYRHLTPGLAHQDITDEHLAKMNQTEPTIDLFPLRQLISRWNPDDVSDQRWLGSPAYMVGGQGHGVPRFNFKNPNALALARRYRYAEVPFIVYNVPAIDEAIEEVFNMQTLLQHFGDTTIQVDESRHKNHFTYYKQSHVRKYLKKEPWTVPQEPVEMKFDDFLYLSEQAEKLGPIIRNETLHYFTISASTGYRLNWLRTALPFFRPAKSFFIVDPAGFNGINCRFGQKGVISTAHYDGGRNFVAMLRGRKRYILLPPNECKNLNLLSRDHPSARHSDVDWSDIDEMNKHPELMDAQATEVVLGPGDVLYIPSYWFHYIMSQDSSIQCNARSGNSNIGRNHIADCGFYDEDDDSKEKKRDDHKPSEKRHGQPRKQRPKKRGPKRKD